MARLPRLCAFAALATLAMTATAATRDDFLYGNTEPDGSGLPYRYFVPPGYDPASAYPVILFLHGAGERGNDNEAQLDNNANGAMYLLDDANLALQPVFMIAPQCPTDGWWSGTTLSTAIGIIDTLAADYDIDPDRVYITGLSMGGIGTWSAVTSQPQRFAAAVPMSGDGSPAAAVGVVDLPFWFFHAANDGTVGVSGSDDLVEALRAAGGSVVYTRYDTGGHAIWPVAYRHPLLFRWIVSQVRGAPSTSAPPLLRITEPTSASSWTTEYETIGLAGSADHDVDPIDSVDWSVLRSGGGMSSGSASGTNAWSVAGVPLDPGANLIRVVATAPSLHDAYGGHTTFDDTLRVMRMGPPPEPGTVVAAIDAAGDGAYTAVDGTVYSADAAYVGGALQYSSVEVAGTDDDALYNAWRYGDFAYHVPVYPGRYAVELQFADTYNSAPGQRVFDVAIEGETVLHDFDIIASVGANAALVRGFDVEVADGMLDVVFSNGSAGNARLDAMRVIRLDDGDALFEDGFDL